MTITGGSASYQPDPDITDALRLLDKTDLVLAIHDASFPAEEGEDTGRGTPYGAGGRSFAAFARSLGFTGLQLGPQGQTSSVNPSPYDGTLFSRNILSLDVKELVDQGLLSRRAWEEIVAGNPRPDGLRVPYDHAFATCNRVMDEAYGIFQEKRTGNDPAVRLLAQECRDLWHSARWLRDDALYEALSRGQGDRSWRHWPRTGETALDRVLCAPPNGLETACARRRQSVETTSAQVLERYTLAQQLLLRQHRAFQESMRALGLKIYGDVQVGFSQRDTWSRQGLLLSDYFMGAPPSRTTAEGQPWSYQVLDPAQYQDHQGRPGPALHLIAERLGKMLSEFDGLRLDHPHGMVCPWVYRADDPDPYHAVQNGARLFSSPDLPDHPRLARHAIAEPGQLNRLLPRYDDNWVMTLTPEQEDRYALMMDTLMDLVHTHGRRREDILCEVLSTEPLPLQRVRNRHGLGRFRVTQKADLDRPGDVYRGENAEPADWLMVGNHDTPSLWNLAAAWHGTDEGMKQAAYLARRLRPEQPEKLASLLASDPRRLAHAKAAELFLSPGRHLMIFFADLFGLKETYNIPGTHNDENWTLRVPPDFTRRYREGRLKGEVLNLHALLAAALRARSSLNCPELIARLEAEAGWSFIT